MRCIPDSPQFFLAAKNSISLKLQIKDVWIMYSTVWFIFSSKSSQVSVASKASVYIYTAANFILKAEN